LKDHPVDSIDIFVITVVAEFVPNPEKNKERAGHSDRQAGDVDDSIEPLFAQNTKSDRHIASNHFAFLA
jgi:hypothetical protein